MTANALILAGYGLNCEEETLYAFEYTGTKGKIIHINDLIDSPHMLDEARILAIPGGFSYGDDTGSGNAFAQKIRLSLQDALQQFIARDTLTIGICNGCQILANLGLIPGSREVAVTYNASNRYQCRWVDLAVNTHTPSPWLADIDTLHIPVAHGEGRFLMEDDTYQRLKDNNQIAATYITPEGKPANKEFPYNPNGSLHDIAAITHENGRVLGVMPHPERGMFTWQRDDYDTLKDQAQRKGETLADPTDGLTLFQNAAQYFK